MHLRNLVFACIILVGFAPGLRAQILTDGNSNSQSVVSAQSGSYYNYSSGSGYDLMVSVWGYVGNPGRYRVPVETNLLDLLSYCGGPNDRAADVYLDRVKIIRKGGAEQPNEIAEVFIVNVEKYFDLRTTPTVTSDLLLYPGDLIIVDGEPIQRDTFIRIAQILVTIASLITSTVAVINIASK